MAQTPIKVAIVDDSPFFLHFLTRTLADYPTIKVIGTFEDSVEALDKVAAMDCDVILVDMEIPKLRGPDFLRKLLPRNPKLKALVISAQSGKVFEALQAGAIDFIPKPNTRPGYDNKAFTADLISKITIAAVAASAIHYTAETTKQRAAAMTAARSASTAEPPNYPARVPLNGKQIIAIGASTGGTEAIMQVLKDLPTNLPGIVIVQHMPPGFTQMYADRLNSQCHIQVKEAKNGDRVLPGTALLAEGDKHMRLSADASGYFVRCQLGEKVSGHCPSVNALFESVAATAKGNSIGVILTGMGADGAQGLLTMRQAGAFTIGQDEASCVVYGMPMAAFKLGAVGVQLPLDKIGGALIRHYQR